MKNHVSPRPSDELSQVGFLLGRTYYTYMGFLERLLDETGLGDHIKPGMGSLLFALFREDDRTISELARELQLARSTMTGMVAQMKKARLISVVKCRQDSRAVRLRLTPLARSLSRAVTNWPLASSASSPAISVRQRAGICGVR